MEEKRQIECVCVCWAMEKCWVLGFAVAAFAAAAAAGASCRQQCLALGLTFRARLLGRTLAALCVCVP